MERQPAVYMLANKRSGTLYLGVTSDLISRTWQHRNHVVDGFTKRYSVDRLVWFELHGSMEAAIVREKQLKKWNRSWKVDLVQAQNPNWDDLWSEIVGTPARVDSRFRGNDEQKR
jgi:putative endonuclease